MASRYSEPVTFERRAGVGSSIPLPRRHAVRVSVVREKMDACRRHRSTTTPSCGPDPQTRNRSSCSCTVTAQTNATCSRCATICPTPTPTPRCGRRCVPPFPMSGYSWYSIDGLSSRDPAAVTAGATRFIEWLETTGAGRVGLIGFSQGGAIALQAMRLAPGTVRLRGEPLGVSRQADPSTETRRSCSRSRRCSGAADPPTRSFRPKRSCRRPEWLPAHSSLVGRVYPGLAHAVSPQEIDDVARFLQKQLT